MRFKMILLVGLIGIGFTAQADELDLQAISCADYTRRIHDSAGDPESLSPIQTIHLWLLGYASAKNDVTVMSGETASAFALQLGKQCHAAPNSSVVEAAVRALKAARKEA